MALGAYSHQDLPFEKLLEALQPPRDLSRTPLFQVLFVLQNTPRQPPELLGLSVEPLEIAPETANFDVCLNLSETPEACVAGWSTAPTCLMPRPLLDGETFADPARGYRGFPPCTSLKLATVAARRTAAAARAYATPRRWTIPTTSVCTSCLKPRWHGPLMPLPCGMRTSTSPTASSTTAPITSRITCRPWG